MAYNRGQRPSEPEELTAYERMTLSKLPPVADLRLRARRGEYLSGPEWGKLGLLG